MTPGLFFSFEGGEGAGKSTQIERLAAWLRGQGRTVLMTRQPGGSDYGRRIRSLILEHHPHEVLAPRAELFLYLADRAHHVDSVIRPALERGEVVLCDRYADSTLAYQGYARGLDLAELTTLNRIATGGLQPVQTFWLDLDPVLGHERIGVRASKDRLESEALEFHQRVRAGYAALAEAEPQRWCRIDASGTLDTVYDSLQSQLENWLKAVV
ncbi:dTMP kinase [bacterium (Candidatus Blackallbacteria) CG17_big_fil_post_rev_8_21_14_2_50_48_46]|uniref:Thymidylate kinase n=1 Tax=bacterium (Candidatus Blackallbacteria) CG17_big_fil_post_rev_8_21_14_2_50_48_46 TaxID=2014261 RepID=A0A2M7G4D9_9BACT|nr:MAG: dTMP kinase [bacterium (Candidatus Blackallbacteria) CG18_big_fil_WC_8_21_14_2_50_49_26]PIW16677.1 MAG: dTMP kinase [bacterium (Candidatus Blackallbacteria) CG17_big_fil_post_rev_8_21_14_2_50_48_46]PIW46183.1 MAG: dTMP kinase [bacterium (Candidatus Blackallbacteria) CG13_big_fil_rev_8_21_14_2_50_49_14]